MRKTDGFFPLQMTALNFVKEPITLLFVDETIKCGYLFLERAEHFETNIERFFTKCFVLPKPQHHLCYFSCLIVFPDSTSANSFRRRKM